MVRNKMSDLADTLFAQLETLDDRDLTPEELATEIERSKAMTSVAGQIVQIGKLAVDAKKAEIETGSKINLTLLE